MSRVDRAGHLRSVHSRRTGLGLSARVKLNGVGDFWARGIFGWGCELECDVPADGKYDVLIGGVGSAEVAHMTGEEPDGSWTTRVG